MHYISGKGKKKAKWKQVALEDILPNTVVRPSQSWADEVEDELNGNFRNYYYFRKLGTIFLHTFKNGFNDDSYV